MVNPVVTLCPFRPLEFTQGPNGFMGFNVLLLMVQKSSGPQLRLVVEIPLFTRLYNYIPGGALRISEPSTVVATMMVSNGPMK